MHLLLCCRVKWMAVVDICGRAVPLVRMRRKHEYWNRRDIVVLSGVRTPALSFGQLVMSMFLKVNQ